MDKVDIKDISGNIILSVSISQDCEHVEELMKSDYVQLSWSTDSNTELPLGAYVDWNNKRYSLLAPYRPLQVNEMEWKYEPRFQSNVMGWSVKPFFFIDCNADGSIKSKETDWTLTDTAANFMSAIVKSIKEETGETWTVVVDASLVGTKSQSFQSTDIFSALNAIASLWETEWWADEANKELHLSKCSYGIQQMLEVGVNIQTPTITENKEGYYTRFYAFGSARNITQDYVTGGSTSHIVQKRLTLPKSTCPNGYKDIRPNLQPGEVNVKVLIFDNIYPSSDLAISNVRSEQRYVVDGEGNKIQIGEKDGQPVYDMYSIFFFKIDGFDFNPASVSNGGMVIDGKNLSVHFSDNILRDREFELSYNKDTKEYEILYDNSTGHIIPNEVLLPSDGDKVILFNIKMPDEYTTSAEAKLEAALDKEIAERQKDLNTYNFKSNAVDFYEKGTTLHIGQKVLYRNGSYQLATRVLTIEEKLDYPCQKTISIGEQKIKGTTQELKEEVTNINKDVNVIAELNNLTTSIQNAYGRTQQQIASALAQWGNMWSFDKSFDTTPNKTDTEKWLVKTPFSLYSEKALSAKGLAFGSGGGGEGGATALYQLNDVSPNAAGTGVLGAGPGKVLTYGTDGKWYAADAVGLDETALGNYLTTNNYAKKSDIPSLAGYATEAWVKKQGYLTEHQSLAGYATENWVNTQLASYATTSVMNTALGKKVDKVEGMGLSSNDFTDTLLKKLNGIAEGANKYILPVAKAAVLGGVMIGSTLTASASGVLDLPEVVTAGTYTKVTTDIYGRVTSGSALSAGDIPALSISKITGLQDALDKKVNKSDFVTEFDKAMQRWFVRDTANKGLHPADYDFKAVGIYSDSYISAKGLNAGAGGGGGGSDYDRLDSWADYDAAKSGYILSAGLGWDLNTRVGALESKSITLTATGEGNGLASFTQTGNNVVFTKANFLTSHQTIYGLTIQRNGTSLGTYTPNSAAKTINIAVPTKVSELSNDSGFALKSYLDDNFPKLDTGLIPASYLPSYVDDVIEAASVSAFPKTGESGKIYVSLDTNLTYRWSGTTYVEISPSLALGETSTTAYAGDKGKANATAIAALKAITISAGTGLTGGGNLTANRTISLLPATTTTLGGIKVGTRLSIDENGVLDATYTYTLPTASATALGGVKVGTTLAISSSVLNLKAVGTTGTYFKVTTDAYGRVTAGSNPTTLAGFGITDGVNAVTVTGSGNAVTAASISGHTLTLTKGTTFLTKATFDDMFEKVNIGTSSTPVYAIKAKYGLYTEQFLSSMGLNPGSSGSGGDGLIETVYGYTDLGGTFDDKNLTNTFNAYTINKLAERLGSVESGAAVTVTPSGTGTVVTGVTKSGTVITVTKGNLAFGSLTGKPTTLAGYGITDAPTKTGTGASGTWGIDVTGYSKRLYFNQSAAVANTLMTNAGLYYNQVSSSTDTGYPTDYGHVIRIQRGVSSTLSSSQAVLDLFHQTGASGLNQLYLRTGYGDGSKMVWGSFVQLLHTGNYTSLITKIGTTTVGGGSRGIYLNAGVPTAISSTVGSSTLPVYMSSGAITACSTTLGVSITGTAPRLIPSELTNQDLNTYTYSSYSGRMYYAGGSNTTTNTPTSGMAYGLMVWRIATGYTGQLLNSSGGYWYSRFYNGTTWSSWNQIAHITDNVASATKLQTARTINGTSFNGTANITTANWGTARAIGIVNSDGTGTAVTTSVNGSAAVNLKLPATIKAALTGNATTATTLQNARTINGTSFNGSANITTASWGTARSITIKDASSLFAGTAVSVNGGANVTLLLPSTIYASTYTGRDRRFNEFLAYYNSTTATLTGTICITLPNAFNSSMNIYEIYLYEYSTDTNASVLTIGAYNYSGDSGKWINYGYHTKGNYNKGVRLGYNGSKCCILLGTTSTKWSYPQVFLKSVLTGYDTQTSWTSGYAISVLTSESGYSNIITPDRTDEYFGTITASLVGNASTATKLQTSRTIFGKAFDGSGNVAGQALVYGTYTETAGSRYSKGGIQVRENGMVGSAQTDDAYAPAIGFHWGSRSAASLIYNTDGFKFRNQAFTGYAPVYAGTTTVDTLNITNLSATSHIKFSRAGYSYIVAPEAGGIVAITAGKAGGTAANCQFVVELNSLHPGTTNAVTNGTASLRWSNINSVLGNFSGRVTAAGLTVGYNNTSYVLSTSSFICNSWVRTVGNTGWFNETHSGGIYMTDTEWVRVYNGKKFYISSTANDALYVAKSIRIGDYYLTSTTDGLSLTHVTAGKTAGLYTTGFLSSMGLNAGTGSGGGGSDYDRLDAWADYTADKAGYVLSAGLGNDLNTRLTTVAANYVTKSGGGASGTWAISITGNAGTATKLGTVTVGSATRPIYLNAGVATICGTSLAVSVTGNAATATTLATARAINGTNFNGSAAITTSLWGTARSIGVVNSDGTGTAVTTSVNGSANVNLKLPATIKASLTGNASTATKLQTARTINGTSFDGSANITTANWGTARNITITDHYNTYASTAVSVNGSANVSLRLPSTLRSAIIQAYDSGSSTVLFDTSPNNEWLNSRYLGANGSYAYEVILLLPYLTSTNQTGTNKIQGRFISYTNGANQVMWCDLIVTLTYNSLRHQISYGGSKVPYTLATCTYGGVKYLCLKVPYGASRQDHNYFFGTCYSSITGGSATQALPKLIKYKTAANGDTAQVINNAEINNSLSDTYVASPVTEELSYYQYLGYGLYPSTTNTKDLGASSLKWRAVYATTFSGALSGNATTATTLATSRTLWGQSFNGSANVSGSLTGVGNITASGAISIVSTGANNIVFKYNNADATSVILNGVAFKPFDAATNKISSGSSTARWSNVYSVLGNFSGNVTVTGAGNFGYTYASMTSGINVIGNTTNNGLCIYDGTGTTARIYRINDIMYIGRAGDSTLGLSINTAGLVTAQKSLAVTGTVTVTSTVSATGYTATSDWYRNSKAEIGLYNSAGDARWYYSTSVDGWRSDKPIYSTSTISGTRLISRIATGTAPFTVASTTAVTNLNADMVDGIHASNLPLEYDASYTPTGTTARWLRIASFDYTSATGSWSGTFAISNSYNNDINRGFVFNVTTSHGTTAPVITQVGGDRGVFTSVRIVKDTTTAYPTAARVYLEVYYNSTSAGNVVYISYRPENRSRNKWTLYTAYTAGSIPTGHTVIAQLSTEIGMATTGGLRVQQSVSILGSTNHNNRLTVQSDGKLVPYSTSTRRSGVYGVYDAAKIGHIWSMGSSYMISDDGSTFGNLYGFAYKHTNNTTGGTMASGHQAVWCENGTPKIALGTNLWVAANAIVGGGVSATGNLSGKTLTIRNTEAIPHLIFSRGSFNYITAPASGRISFVVNGQDVNEAASDLIINNGYIYPGTTNATSNGTASFRWSNTYTQLLNVAGTATIQAVAVAGASSFSSTVTIASTLNLNGVFNANNTTDATSTTAAGAVFDGGVGIVKQLRVGGVSTFTGKATFNGGLAAAASTFSSTITVPYTGSSWISLATRTNIIQGSINQTESSAHGLYRVKSFGGNAVIFGGLNNNVGFYGIYKATIDAGTNQTDWSTVWNTTTGLLTHNKALTVSGATTLNSTLTVASTVAFNLATDATSTTAAAVKLSGGMGIVKQLRVGGATTLSSTLAVTGVATLSSTVNVSGVLNANNTTDATSTTAAGAVFDGGVGIVKQLRVGGAATLSSTLSVSSTATIAGVLNNTNTTDATSTTAAALKTAGGLGVAKQLRVGGAATLSSTLAVSGIVTFSNATDVTDEGANGAVKLSGSLASQKRIYAKVGMFSDGYMSSKGLNETSDMRLKNKVRDIFLPVKDIANAPAFEYTWKDGTPGVMVGSSAQYWESVLTGSVRKGNNGYLTMFYGHTALVATISLARHVETLEEKVIRLERENEEKDKRISELERRIS